MLNILTTTSYSHHRFDWSLLIYRILISLSLFNTHGYKKLINLEETAMHIPDPLGIGGELSAYFAVFANVICPLFIALGLFTRLFTLPILSITLLGFFVVHANDPWPVRDVPLMYSIAFSLLLPFGAGKYSLDHYLSTKK